MSLTNGDPEQIRTMLRRELTPIAGEAGRTRLKMEARFERVEKAIAVLANRGPGTTPERESHVARRVEKVLSPWNPRGRWLPVHIHPLHHIRHRPWGGLEPGRRRGCGLGAVLSGQRPVRPAEVEDHHVWAERMGVVRGRPARAVPVRPSGEPPHPRPDAWPESVTGVAGDKAGFVV